MRSDISEPSGQTVPRIRPGGPEDAQALLALFDEAVDWLAERGQTGQWGSEPFSSRDSAIARCAEWAASGGLWLPGGGGGGPPRGAAARARPPRGGPPRGAGGAP